MKKLLLLIPLLFIFTACGSLQSYTLDYDDQGYDDREDQMMQQLEEDYEHASEAQEDYYNRED